MLNDWPDRDFWYDLYESEDDIEDAWHEYLCDPESEVEAELEIFTEPSVQGSIGDMYIYDESGEDRFDEIQVDYTQWCNKELEMAANSSSAEEYKQKYRRYIKNLIRTRG